MTTIISVIGGILLLIACGTVLLHLQARHIARERHGEGYEDFQRYFFAKEIEELVVSSVYRYFQDWMLSPIVQEFPVRPTDTIDGIYGIVDEDVEDMVKDVMKKANRQMPSESETTFPIILRTVEDMVNFVARCPKQAREGRYDNYD